MFERFTKRAHRVVTVAQEEARSLNHDYIGTEHLLLGLLEVSDGLAAQALNATGVHLEDTRRGIEAMIGRGTTTPKGHIPFTPRAKKCLELSLREALKLGHNYIGTEHVLLGILGEGEGVAVKLLVQQTNDLAALRQHLVALMSNLTGQAAGAEGLGFRAAETIREAIRKRREGEPGSSEVGAPCCPNCQGDLEASAAYRIVAVPEADGEGQASVLFVFCRICGHTLDSLIAPEDT